MNDVGKLQSTKAHKVTSILPNRKGKTAETGFSPTSSDGTLLSQGTTTRTNGILKTMMGIKEPQDYIGTSQFYETPFKLKALVPRMEDVKMVITPTTYDSLEAITYSGIRSRQNLYLRGTTGMGKTNLVLFSMARIGMPLYEISGEDTMNERNLIGRILPGQNGGFEWQDGKVTKAIKPVTQVPLPFLDKPAKADLLPQGTIVEAKDAQEVNGYNWIQVQDLRGKSGWVLSDSLSKFKTPQAKLSLKDSPDGKNGFSVKPGDLLGVVEQKKVAGERWLLVKTPVKDIEDPLKTTWQQGWVKTSDLADVVASRYGTQLFEEPQNIKGMVEPGVSLYWDERSDEKEGGNVTWSRVHLPDQFNSPGEEGYLPDCAPRPDNPVLEHNFIRASGLLLDESNLIQPGVKKRLNSLLDKRKMLVVDENRNEKVRRHPTSLIFLTGNPLSYSGREQESADFLRRCHVVSAPDYKPSDYRMILGHLSNLDNFTKDRIIGYHIQMVDMARGVDGKPATIGRRTGPYAYGTRDLMKLASHVNKLMPEISKKIDAETPVFGVDVSTEGSGLVPVTSSDPVATLKSGESVQILSHELHDGDDWTRVRFGKGDVGYVKGKLEGESLNQLIWRESRKIYERRIVDENEKKAIEVQLGLFFDKSNQPEEAGVPAIKKADDTHYQFGDTTLEINPPGGSNVPDAESAGLIVNERTPEAARREEMIAQQISHGEDTMLVGPTASGKTSYVADVCMRINRNLSYFNASDQTDKTRFIGKLVHKRGGGQFDFEWQNGLFTEAIVPKAIRPTQLYAEPGLQALETVPQNTPLYYLKQQKTVNGELYSLVQKHNDWMADTEQTGKNAVWVKDKDIQSDAIMIDEGNAARSGALEGANSLFDKNRRFLMLEDFDGRKVFAHPSCVIFFTANPPEHAGLRYTGVNQISPAARNRFTEIWFPEISPMPLASDVNDHSLDGRRKAEDSELKAYMETWLKHLPNNKEISDWAVDFYREVRNKAARHEIGAQRPSGEPLIYTIGNLANLASKIKEFSRDEVEWVKAIGAQVEQDKHDEFQQVTEEAQQSGASDQEIQKIRTQWLNQQVRDTLSSMTPEQRLALGGKVAFITQAYHEFADDFESDADKKAVKALVKTIVESTPPAEAEQDQAA